MTDSELLQAIYKDTQELKSRLNSIENNVTDLQLTLENETNRNITLIAEGHLNLSRKEKINVIAK
jgi:archaellum component FlaC